jgi:HD-like signal output (HDOD) protein
VRSWLAALRRRWAGVREAGSDGPVRVAPPAGAPELGGAAPPPDPAPPETDGEVHPFARFARALGIEVPAEPAPLSEEDEAADAALAAAILARFSATRPEAASFPSIALQVLNVVADPAADVAELSRLVARDPALSAGVLSVANSPVYRGRMEIETVRDAVARLGLAEVAKVTAAVAARSLFSPKVRAEAAAVGDRWRAVFSRSVAVGGAAASLALSRPGARADRAYLGGLLHDVGLSLALRALGGLVADGRVPPPAPERLARALDRVHVEVGGEAHQAWGLPQYLTVLCVRHHDEAVPADPEFVDLHAVRLASALALLGDPPLAARAAREVAQSAGALGLDPFAVRSLATELRQGHERARAAFGAARG